MAIVAKVGVTCDDPSHEGERSESTIGAELTPEGLVKLNGFVDGWWIAEGRGYYGDRQAQCPTCNARERDSWCKTAQEMRK